MGQFKQSRSGDVCGVLSACHVLWRVRGHVRPRQQRLHPWKANQAPGARDPHTARFIYIRNTTKFSTGRHRPSRHMGDVAGLFEGVGRQGWPGTEPQRGGGAGEGRWAEGSAGVTGVITVSPRSLLTRPLPTPTAPSRLQVRATFSDL